ncbi:MAG: hypothetical protein IPL54_09690 [Chitinophagaceae bacterium]|nr:hypothetical protein [Chitinophagaceae bacterium]
MAWSLSKTYFTDGWNFDCEWANEDYAAGKTFMDMAITNISLIVFWISAILLAVLPL